MLYQQKLSKHYLILLKQMASCKKDILNMYSTISCNNSNLLNYKKLLLHQNGAGVSALEQIVLVSVFNIIVNSAIVIFQNEQAFKVNHISTFGVG